MCLPSVGIRSLSSALTRISLTVHFPSKSRPDKAMSRCTPVPVTGSLLLSQSVMSQSTDKVIFLPAAEMAMMEQYQEVLFLWQNSPTVAWLSKVFDLMSLTPMPWHYRVRVEESVVVVIWIFTFAVRDLLIRCEYLMSGTNKLRYLLYLDTQRHPQYMQWPFLLKWWR